MTIELLYTSAAQGLKQGSRGFCTVVCTAGLPINLAQRLEALSGYRHLYQPGDVKADENPVCHSHIRLVVGGKTLSIVSRVAAYGVDYSQRTNKIAHHVVFDGSVPSCGPAAVLSQSTVMRATWDGECKTLASGPVVPPLSLQPSPCQHWQKMAGDAGWAGVVANAWLQPTGKPVWIIFSESQSKSLLMMMQEATALLTESRRWQATFSTYCTNLPPDVECRVRCVVAGSDEARMSIARGVVLDLTKPLGMAPESEVADAARNGFAIGTKTTSTPAVTSVPDKYEEPDDDFETAFAEGTSEEEDYSLQPQLPSVAPILIKSPKTRGKLKTKRMVAEPPAGAFTNRTLLLAIAGVAILLSLLGGFTIWFASNNPLAGVVDSKPTPKQEEPIDSATQNQKGKEIREKDPAGGSSESEPATSPVPPPKESPKISISQSIFNIVENEVVPANYKIASLSFENAEPHEFNINLDSNDLEVLVTEIRLKPQPGGYNHEEKPEIKGRIIVAKKDSTPIFEQMICVKVKNIDEKNLDIMVVDDNGQTNPKAVFEGAKLIAEVTPESNDEDEIKPGKRSFIWKGRRGEGPWKKLSESKEILLNSNFSEVYCELRYDTNLPTPEDVPEAESKKIAINPVGEAGISFNSIFSGNDLDLSIEIAFPKLDIPKGKQKNPFFWAKHDHYLLGNTLKVLHKMKLVRESPSRFTLNTENLQFVPVGDVQLLQQSIYDVRERTETVRLRIGKLKSATSVMKLITDKSRVGLAFVRFVNQLEVKPKDAFFESVEAVDAWLTKAVALKYAVDEIVAIEDANKEKDPETQKNNALEIKKKNEQKQVDLKDLELEYAEVFPTTQATLFPSSDAENEIVGFARYWELNQNPNGQRNSFSLKEVRTSLQELVVSIRSLRDAMQSLGSLKFVLESTDGIKIWPVVTSTASAPFAPKKLDKDALCTSIFRLRTTVLFDDVKFDRKQPKSDGNSIPKQEQPSSQALQPASAQEGVK